MTLPVVPVSPGWATGVAHVVDDPNRWSSGRDAPEVLVLPALWWASSPELPPRTRAVILVGVPRPLAPPASLPVVAGVEPDLVLEGETVEVNGSKGSLLIAGVQEVRVVTSLLERDDGKILLLLRSDRVGSFRGRWAGVSGYLEDPTALDGAYREIREEVGLRREELRLVAAGEPVLSRDRAQVYVVHPFRFRVRSPEVRLDWEHVRAEWVDPSEIRRRSTVPKLDRVWESLSAALLPKG